MRRRSYEFSCPNARILRDACDSVVKRSGGQGAPGRDRFEPAGLPALGSKFNSNCPAIQLELPGASF
jgi:hypothetical protein